MFSPKMAFQSHRKICDLSKGCLLWVTLVTFPLLQLKKKEEIKNTLKNTAVFSSSGRELSHQSRKVTPAPLQAGH